MEVYYREKVREVQVSVHRGKQNFIIKLVKQAEASTNSKDFLADYRITKEFTSVCKPFDAPLRTLTLPMTSDDVPLLVDSMGSHHADTGRSPKQKLRLSTKVT